MSPFVILLAIRLIWFLIEFISEANRDEPAHPVPAPRPAPLMEEDNWHLSIERAMAKMQPLFPSISDLYLRLLLRPLIGNWRVLNDMVQHHYVRQARHFFGAIQYWHVREGNGLMHDLPLHQHFRNPEEYFAWVVTLLYEEHPVPPVVVRLWWTYIDNELPMASPHAHPEETLTLYFYLTKGGGLRQAPFLEWEMSQRVAGYFHHASGHLSVREAYWYAHFQAAGLTAEMLERHTPAVPSGYTDSGFWRKMAQMWLHDSKEFPHRVEQQMVIRQIEWLKFGMPHEEFLRNERTAAKKGQLAGLNLQGHSWASLVRFLEEEAGLARFPLPQGMDFEYALTGANGQRYQMRFLSNEHALMMEGDYMGHCVGNPEYVEMAWNGDSFWSLRQMEPKGRFKRQLTIHVSNGCIEEASGSCNRAPEPEEWQVMEAWLAAHVHPFIQNTRQEPVLAV
ncbi:MAG TPA: PcfJ domain-containing protein [Saprospiraceae bacterium]|nr:PcfJ domain-containing protein [Saprospiraceae bacterium]